MAQQLIVEVDSNMLNPLTVDVGEYGSCVEVRWWEGRVLWRCDTVEIPDTLGVIYGLLPVVPVRDTFFLYRRQKVGRDTTVPDVFIYGKLPWAPYYPASTQSSGIRITGSVEQGFSAGSTQDVTPRSGLDIRISGSLTKDVEVSGYLSDRQVPLEAEGVSQSVREFDRVFLEFTIRERHRVRVGDVVLRLDSSRFVQMSRQSEGLVVMSSFPVGRVGATLKVGGGGTRSQFARNEFFAKEGNYGPYRLRGASAEEFVVVVSGSERVWLDGRLLQRGEERDYVIDYAKAEITFTPAVVITKDSRIIVEFEYLTLSYPRYLYTVEQGFAGRRSATTFFLAGIEDVAVRPLWGELDTASLARLRAAGDSVSLARLSTIKPAVSSTAVLYRLTDTVVEGVRYDSVLVYVPNGAPDTLYQAVFTFVGFGNGSYVLAEANTNGKVYKWVAPVNGVPQGAYEPVQLLPAPRRQRWLGMRYTQLVGKGKLVGEGALSFDDRNVLSSLHDNDNTGAAVSIAWSLPDTLPLAVTGEYFFVSHTFNAPERFLPPEFERDWAVGSVAGRQMHYGVVRLSGGGGRVYAGAEGLLVGDEYRGVKPFGGVVLGDSLDVVGARAGASVLSASEGGGVGVVFVRPAGKMVVRYPWGLPVLVSSGVNAEWLERAMNDSLLRGSGGFWEWCNALTFGRDTAAHLLSLSHVLRNDYLPFGGVLMHSATSNTFTMRAEQRIAPSLDASLLGSLRLLTVYRDTVERTLPPFTATGRLTVGWRPPVRGLFIRFFYEAGRQQTQRIAYQYVEVPAGKGYYTWIDFNGDGIQQQEEFQPARYPDQARWIRVLVPTGEYVPTTVARLSLTGRLVTGKWFDLSGNASLHVNFMRQAGMWAFVPFFAEIPDTLTVSQSSGVSGMATLNRTGRLWRLTLTGSYSERAQLTTAGLQTATFRLYEADLRVSPLRNVEVFLTPRWRHTSRLVAFSAQGSYAVVERSLKQKILYTPVPLLQLSFYGRVSFKEAGISATATLTEAGAGARFLLSGTYLSADVGLLSVVTKGVEGSNPAVYELTEALSVGRNIVVNISASHRFGKDVNATLTYLLRGSEGSPVVHTGTFVVRYLF